MASIPPPPQWWRTFARESYSYDFALAWFSLLAGVAGVIAAGQRGSIASAWLLGFAASGVFVVSLGKAYAALSNSAERSSTHELEGCLETLLALLQAKYDSDLAAGLRVTVHTPIDDGSEFVQVIDYVGDDRGGETAGRRFAGNAGVIGACRKEKDPVYGTRQNHVFSSYVSELEKNWNFTNADAKSKNQQTMSWLAVPLLNGSDDLDGVVYLDSIQPAYFDREGIRADVAACCAGIANFVARRYG